MAAKWYRKGALGGDPEGWGNLARMYAHERGVALRFVRVDSEDTASLDDARGENAVDGNPDTFWRTQWQGNRPGLPHEIIIELVPPSTIEGFTYLPRQDDWDYGNIKDYEFYASNDGKDFGQPVKKGTFQSGKEKKTATFDPVECRFIKLKAISEIEGRPSTSVAEIGVVLSEVVTLTRIPLTDAIQQLANQMGLPIKFDPALLNQKRADGTPIPPPTVMEKWKKVTPFQALQALLENYGWQMTLAPGSINLVSAKDPKAPGTPADKSHFVGESANRQLGSSD